MKLPIVTVCCQEEANKLVADGYKLFAVNKTIEYIDINGQGVKAPDYDVLAYTMVLELPSLRMFDLGQEKIEDDKKEKIINEILGFNSQTTRDELAGCTVFKDENRSYPMSEALKNIHLLKLTLENLDINGYTLVPF